MIKSVLQSCFERFQAFRDDEDGAVTVDFIVLTSSIVMLGLAHAKDVADGTVNIADDIDGCLSTDISSLVVGGDPNNHVANLQAAAAACSAR